MASAKYYFIVVIVLTVPFVENAPSNIVKPQTKEEEFRTRLVFIDRDADDISSNSQMTATGLSETSRDQVQKTSLTRIKHFADSVQTQNGPSLKMKASTSSSLSNMDDERQIWGIADDNIQLVEDESLYNRPLFLPRHVVKVQNATKHPDLSSVVDSSKLVRESSIPKPSACDMSIVICCRSNFNLKECFNSMGCSNATEDMFSYLCSSDSINKIIKELGKYYKRNQEK